MPPLCASFLADTTPSQSILELGPMDRGCFGTAETLLRADIIPLHTVRQQQFAQPVSATLTADRELNAGLSSLVAEGNRFEVIVASRVLELVPRLLEFFQDMAALSPQRGRLFLFMEDCRLGPARLRPRTGIGELWAVQESGLPCAPWRALEAETQTLLFPETTPLRVRWSGAETGRSPEALMGKALSTFQRTAGEFTPGIRYGVFSPRSFLLLLYNLLRADWLPFILDSFFPSDRASTLFGAELVRATGLKHNPEWKAAELRKLVLMLEDPLLLALPPHPAEPAHA